MAEQTMILAWILVDLALSQVIFDLNALPLRDLFHNNTGNLTVAPTGTINISTPYFFAELSPNGWGGFGTFNVSGASRTISVDVNECNVRTVMAVAPLATHYLSLEATLVVWRGDSISVLFGGVVAVQLRPSTGAAVVRILKSLDATEFDPHIDATVEQLYFTAIAMPTPTSSANGTRFAVAVRGAAPMLIVSVAVNGEADVAVNATVNIGGAATKPKAFQVYSQWHGRFDIEGFVVREGTTVTGIVTMASATATAATAATTGAAANSTDALALTSASTATPIISVTIPDGDGGGLVVGIGVGLAVLLVLIAVAVVLFWKRRASPAAPTPLPAAAPARSSEYGSLPAPEYASPLVALS